MIPKNQFLFLAASALLLVVACHKTPAPEKNNPTNIATLSEPFKDLRSTPEKQCVTAGAYQTITFAKGTRLTFYPKSFKDAAGSIITSGTVCIEMIEMYKAGDMIANRASTTTTDGGILMSGGQVHIKATKDGQEVYANKYGIAFKQPAASTQPMDLYYGKRNSDSVITWTKANTASPGTSVPGTTIDSTTVYYMFDSCTDFNFINCDQLRSTAARTDAKVKINNSDYNPLNTQVLLLLPSINSIINFKYNKTTKIFEIGKDIPVGMAAAIVIISNANGEYLYYEHTNMTVAEGFTVNATMTKETREGIKTKLSAL